MNFMQLPRNWNESSIVIAPATWLSSVSLPLLPSFDKEGSTGDNSPLGLAVRRSGSCPTQVG